jgi:hypothetical protein
MHVILLHTMLESSRLDTVVEHVFETLCSQYEVGEYINCLWDDGIAYVDIFHFELHDICYVCFSY